MTSRVGLAPPLPGPLRMLRLAVALSAENKFFSATSLGKSAIRLRNPAKNVGVRATRHALVRGRTCGPGCGLPRRCSEMPHRLHRKDRCVHERQIANPAQSITNARLGGEFATNATNAQIHFPLGPHF